MSKRITADDIVKHYKELGYPSAPKLHAFLKARGFQISLKDVLSFTRAQPVRQVFQKSPWSRKNAGQITAFDVDGRWFADLIQQTSNPSGGYKYILVVQDVFSRKLFAEPLRSKEPPEVAAALRRVIADEKAPDILETDGGLEFTGPVQTLLRERGIQMLRKHPLQRNAHATLDRAIASLRQTLSRIETEKGKEWPKVLDQAVAAYNRSPHAALGPAAPDEVEDDPVLRYSQQKQNVQMAHDNAVKAKKIQTQFEKAGHFRMPHPAARTRGHRQRWGEAHEVIETRPGVVTDLFNEYPARQALPVEVAGPDVKVPKALSRGPGVPEKFRAGMRKFVAENAPVTITEFQDHLRSLGARVRVTAQIMEDFGLTRAGNRWSRLDEKK
jgi:hypothetical protein